VIDLGVDVAPATFVETAADKDADIIAVSALLTTTMTGMADVVTLKNERALASRILIGGAPLSLEYCREIGADGYGVDARQAVAKARELIGS
jgi:5-methyltetrahydrofolate--homocysteine methyltransferase